ncbi:hypothetical protein LJR230_004808 [Trinickia sp. LjRoot230]
MWLSGCAVRPTPFTGAERTQSVRDERTEMFAGAPELKGPVTLEEAMARAIRYNLDHRPVSERGIACETPQKRHRPPERNANHQIVGPEQFVLSRG